MNSLKKLAQLNKYLRCLRLPGRQDVTFSYVTNQADATSRLDKASGAQVLMARPDCSLRSISEDHIESYLDTVIFVLDKDLGAGKTDAAEEKQYDKLEAITGDILDLIYRTIAESSCEMLSGFRLASATVTPEAMIFGGWTGYSIELSFEG